MEDCHGCFVSGADVVLQAEAVRHSKFYGTIRASMQTIPDVERSSLTSYGLGALIGPPASVSDIRSDGESVTVPHATVSSHVKIQ